MSTFFASRVWCSVCPIGALSAALRRFGGLDLKVPLFVRRHGPVASAVLIIMVFWAEVASGMVRSPRATALLVLSIVALASASGLLLQRNAWCRYFCPLGGMVGLLSSCSVLELRAHTSICNNTCKKHDCFIGSEEQEGCPMFEGPFSLSSNLNCILCGSCIKSCPHQSPVLNLRLPGYDLWSVQVPDRAFVILGMALISTQLFRGIVEPGWVGSLDAGIAMIWLVTLVEAIAAFLLTALFIRAAGRTVFGKRGRAGEYDWHRIVYAFLPLAFAYEAGYHLNRLLTLAGQFLTVLGRQTGSLAELPGASASPAVVMALQAILVMLGAAGSTSILKHLLKTGADENDPAPSTINRAWPILVLAIIYLCMFLAG